MKRLNSMLHSIYVLKKQAQTENIRNIPADESDEKITAWFQTAPYEFDRDDFYIHRSIGLWGCWARQDIVTDLEHPIIYFVEVYQLNKSEHFNKNHKVPDKLSLVLVWYYGTTNNRYKTDNFEILPYLNKSAAQTKAFLLNNKVDLKTQKHKLVMLPLAEIYQDANRQAIKELKKLNETTN